MEELEIQILIDTLLYREAVLDSIKDPKLQMEQKKIWAIEDGAEKIAKSIANRPVRRKFLGIF